MSSPSSGSSESLVSIHNRVLKILLGLSWEGASKNDSDCYNAKQQPPRIDSICQERCFLRMELEQRRLYSSSSSFPTVADEIEISTSCKRSRQATCHLKSVHHGKAAGLVSSATRNEATSWTNALYRLRKRQKIAALHRLAGISVTPLPDPDLLGVRFDICDDSGQYVTCHHVFWDVIVKDDSLSSACKDIKDTEEVFAGEDSESSVKTSLSAVAYMRVLQHDLPALVPLNAILQRILGGERLLKLGPLQDAPHDDDDDGDSSDKEWEIMLRACCQAIYDACYYLTVREYTWKYLESLSHENRNDMHNRAYLPFAQGGVAKKFSVDQLTRTDSYDVISFHLHLSSDEDDGILLGMAVELTFTFKQARPEKVSILRLASGKRTEGTTTSARISQAGAVSDDEEDDDNDIAERLNLFESKLQESLKCFPVDRVLSNLGQILFK